MNSAGKPGWQQLTALVSLSAGGAITGLSFVPGPAADLTSPAGVPVHLLALEKAAKPAPAADAKLRGAIVNVANYYLRMAAGKTPAEMQALIWQHASVDGVNHGASCAAFASLTLELAAHVVGQHSWVSGGTSYPWPLQKWADVRVNPNPASPGIVSIRQDAQAHQRWHPLGDGYAPQPGDWVMFDGHVEVVTKYAGGVLHTVGGDSLPNYSVNAHEYPAPLAGQGVTGFVNNGALLTSGATASAGDTPLAGGGQPRGHTDGGQPTWRHAQAGQASAGQASHGQAGLGRTGPGTTSQERTGSAPAIPGTSGVRQADRRPEGGQSGPGQSGPGRPGRGQRGSGQSGPGQSGPGRADLAGASLGGANMGGANRGGANQAGAVPGGADLGHAAVPGTSPARGRKHRPPRAWGSAAIPGMPAPVASLSKHLRPMQRHRSHAPAQAAGAGQPRAHAGRGDAGTGLPGTDLPWTTAHARSARAGSADIPGARSSAHGDGAAPAPRRAPASAPRPPRGPTASATGFGSEQAFIGQIVPGAVAAQRKYGVPASVTIAQAIEESGWGRSKLATRDHNVFGIKGTGPAGSDAQPTREYENGRSVTRIASFRVYHSVAQSIDDHGNLLATSEYYRQAMALRGDPNAFANALTGIYATDPHYGAKLIDLMRQYNLYRYDVAAPDVTPGAAAPSVGTATRGTPPAGTPSAASPGSAAPRRPAPRKATPQAGAPQSGAPQVGGRTATPGAGAPRTAAPQGGARRPGTRGAGATRPSVPGASGSQSSGRGAATHGSHRPGTASIPGVPGGTPAPLAGAAPPAPSPEAAPGPAAVPGADQPVSTSTPSTQAVSAERVTAQTPSAEAATTGAAAPKPASARASRYRPQIPPAVRDAFLSAAKRPLMRAEPLHRDVAGAMGIPWEVLAACDWMQCEAHKRYSPVHGERLGTLNPDGTVYRTKSEALQQAADDLVGFARAVYGIDLTAPGPLSVRDLANVFAAFRWGALLKLHHTSAMEFPYSVAGLTSQHTRMRWPNIDDPNAPDKPGARFRMPFGAVPVVLCLKYPAIA